MENYILAMLFFVLGGISIWYSKQKAYFEKTAEQQGGDVASRKFRVIKMCAYGLLTGGGLFIAFAIIGI